MNYSLTTLSFLALSSVAQSSAATALDNPAGDETSLFDAPEVVLTEDHPFTGEIYPTPVLADLNGDGRVELVVGDLRGRMRFATREGHGLKWSKMQPMESGGEPLKLNNW